LTQFLYSIHVHYPQQLIKMQLFYHKKLGAYGNSLLSLLVLMLKVLINLLDVIHIDKHAIVHNIMTKLKNAMQLFCSFPVYNKTKNSGVQFSVPCAESSTGNPCNNKIMILEKSLATGTVVVEQGGTATPPPSPYKTLAT